LDKKNGGANNEDVLMLQRHPKLNSDPLEIITDFADTVMEER